MIYTLFKVAGLPQFLTEKRRNIVEDRALLVQALSQAGVTLIWSNAFTHEEDSILQVGDVDPDVEDKIVHIFSEVETKWLGALLDLMQDRDNVPPPMVAQIISSIWTAATRNTASVIRQRG